MLHRAGNVDGEGDGCGVLLDIPRKIWAEEIRAGGHASHLALDPQFVVGHIFVARKGGNAEETKARARDIMSRFGLRVLAEREDVVDSSALGPTAREEEPIFWQVGGLTGEARLCFELAVALEQELDVHVASFSTETCVYKVMGAPSVLGKYYPDLLDERAETAAVIGHNRYSTNTWPSFRRVQPFSMLGHNGEINTIAQLREEARMLGVPIRPDGSDSQDLNRLSSRSCTAARCRCWRRSSSCCRRSSTRSSSLPEELRPSTCTCARRSARSRRARWRWSRATATSASSRSTRSACARSGWSRPPTPTCSPPSRASCRSGDGVGAQAARPRREGDGQPQPREGRGELRQHIQLQRLACERWVARTGEEPVHGFAQTIPVGGPLEGPEIPGYTAAGPAEPVKVEDRVLAGIGWQREDMKLVQQMATTAPEPIGSLGYDGPLAASRPSARTWPTTSRRRSPSSPTRRSTASARWSTSPAARCSARGPRSRAPAEPRTVETAFPIILGGPRRAGAAVATRSTARWRRSTRPTCSRTSGSSSAGAAACSTSPALESETTQGAIERLKHEAAMAVRDGAELLVLSDRTAYDGRAPLLDPHLAVAAVDKALREACVERRGRTCAGAGLVLRSGAIRNVHDVMVALGLGADGVCPYVMIEVGRWTTTAPTSTTSARRCGRASRR